MVDDSNESTIKVLLDIKHERGEQDEEWGQQDHPSSHSAASRMRYRGEAERWRQINSARVQDGTLAWDGILLEEVFEALAEGDDALRRAELVQVAAVAVAEIEAIDRRNGVTDGDGEPQAVAA